MTTIIGIDCATDPKKTGLCLARFDRGLVAVEQALLASSTRPAYAIAAEWLLGAERAIVALDAPLGWPVALASELATHSAGAGVSSTADAMFRRSTDERIRVRFNKRPLEVGANLIARTAHAALRLLADLREATGTAIPLAWYAGEPDGTVAIEVYPAATRLAQQARSARSDGPAMPGAILPTGYPMTLPETMTVPDSVLGPGVSEHVIDALWCVAAAADFCNRDAESPGHIDMKKVLREGWIWTLQG